MILFYDYVNVYFVYIVQRLEEEQSFLNLHTGISGLHLYSTFNDQYSMSCSINIQHSIFNVQSNNLNNLFEKSILSG